MTDREGAERACVRAREREVDRVVSPGGGDGVYLKASCVIAEVGFDSEIAMSRYIN